MTRRIIAATAVALTAVTVAWTGPAWAGGGGDGDGTDWNSHQGTHGVGVTGSQPGQDGYEHQVGNAIHNGSYTPPSQWTEYRYIPACSVNRPEGGADALCMAAVASCPDKGDIRFWAFTRTVYANGSKPTDWVRKASVCRGADDPPLPTQPVVTKQMVTKAARALAPKATLHIEPAAQSYVNVPNNFYADTATVTRTLNLFGHSISVAFKPGDFQWKFGDGDYGSGVGVAHAAVHQAGAVEHAYARQGTYAVSVVSRYAVSFTLPNGQTVRTQVAGFPSAPSDLDVGEIQTQVTGVS